MDIKEESQDQNGIDQQGEDEDKAQEGTSTPEPKTPRTGTNPPAVDKSKKSIRFIEQPKESATITPTKTANWRSNNNFQIQQEDKPMHLMFTNKNRDEVTFANKTFMKVKIPELIKDIHQYGRTLT